VSGALVDPPREMVEVVTAAMRLLEDMVRAGLSHPSEMTSARLTTLSMSALGCNLHRLSSALRALGDEVEMLIGRDAGADEERVLARAGTTYALCTAIMAALPDAPEALVGRARTRYDEIPLLELAGLGAYEWRTGSGYSGLTVVLWAPEKGEWYTWTDARPEFRGSGMVPARRYRGPGPWMGVPSPEEASKSHLRLSGAKRNHYRRLSSSSGTTAAVTGRTELSSLGLERTTFTSWGDLLGRAVASRAMGLEEPDPLSALAVLKPARWGARMYDEVEQALRWELIDEDGDVLEMVIRNEPADAHKLRRLEAMDPASEGVWGVLGQVRLGPDGATVYPISMLRFADGQGDVVDISFEPREGGSAAEVAHLLVRPHGRSKARDGRTAPDAIALTGSSVGEVVGRLVSELALIAERGGTTLPHGHRVAMESVLLCLEGLGLDTLASSVRKVVSGSGDFSPAVLRTRFLCQLALEAATLTTVRSGRGQRRGWAARLLDHE